MRSDTLAERLAHLATRPWNADEFRATIPQHIFSVTGMLWEQEKRMLYYLSREEYSGEGAIADMGSFLGGSTICLAAGLRANRVTPPVIHSYDLFVPGEFERREYFSDDPSVDPRALFDQHLKDYLDLITVHQGDVLGFPWDQGPIEILFVDIAKSYKVFDHLLLEYFPALIPMKSLVILQDYLSPQTGPWHHIVMEKLSDYCEYVIDCDTASVIFFLKSPIPPEALRAAQWMEMSMEEKLRLMESAIGKLDTEAKRDFLRSNREILVQGRDESWGMGYHEL